MRDVREEILGRLLAVIGSIPNIKLVQRNSGIDIPDDLLPAADLFDGEEEGTTTAPTSSRPREQAALKYLVEMTPQILVREQADQTDSEIDVFRRELIKGVLGDTALLDLVGTNGQIRYIGCQVGLAYGQSLQRALVAQFTFKYPLKIEEL